MGSRLLAVLPSVYALAEISYLPSTVFSILHYREGTLLLRRDIGMTTIS